MPLHAHLMQKPIYTFSQETFRIERILQVTNIIKDFIIISKSNTKGRFSAMHQIFFPVIILLKTMSFLSTHSSYITAAKATCHVRSLYPGRGQHPTTIDGLDRTLSVTYLTRRKTILISNKELKAFSPSNLNNCLGQSDT